ncbi:MAG: hypothetical protein U1D67_03545 [Dehalococcoidia bacterium]|nr:hypothetical protein [Dehalococcoidia bacterium]
MPDLIIPQAQDPATQSPIKPVAKPPATETKHLCPIHKNAELYRNEKNGSVWYSHKLENGKYCNGNAPKQSEPPVTTDKKPEATPGAVVGQPKGKIETVTIEQQWNQIGELGRKLGRSTADACKFVGKVQKEWRSIPAAQLADIINAWSQEAAGMEQLPFGEGE